MWVTTQTNRVAPSIQLTRDQVHSVATVGKTVGIMKVLIIDDNACVRWLIRTMIEDLVDEFCECTDGITALDAYTASLPDLVLMDIAMNQLDGISAARQIRGAYNSAAIIMLTDYDDVDLRTAAKQSGACEYVVKDELYSLRQILEAKRIE
jgi:CheY-like chemotaxis protein